MKLITRNFLLLARVLVKVFPVSTVERAKRFTRLTTTDVRANKPTLAKTARTVSCFSFSLSLSAVGLNFRNSGLTGYPQI